MAVIVRATFGSLDEGCITHVRMEAGEPIFSKAISREDIQAFKTFSRNKQGTGPRFFRLEILSSHSSYRKFLLTTSPCPKIHLFLQRVYFDTHLRREKKERIE